MDSDVVAGIGQVQLPVDEYPSKLVFLHLDTLQHFEALNAHLRVGLFQPVQHCVPECLFNAGVSDVLGRWLSPADKLQIQFQQFLMWLLPEGPRDKRGRLCWIIEIEYLECLFTVVFCKPLKMWYCGRVER